MVALGMKDASVMLVLPVTMAAVGTIAGPTATGPIAAGPPAAGAISPRVETFASPFAAAFTAPPAI